MSTNHSPSESQSQQTPLENGTNLEDPNGETVSDKGSVSPSDAIKTVHADNFVQVPSSIPISKLSTSETVAEDQNAAEEVELQPYDWSGLEWRYLHALKEVDERENSLVELFQTYAEVMSQVYLLLRF